MHNTSLVPRAALAPLTLVMAMALTACGSMWSQPQGYGVMNSTQETALQAQQQLEKAEQLNQADPKQTYLSLIRQMQEKNQWYASLAHTDAFEQQHGSTASVRLLRADAQRNTGQSHEAEQNYSALLTDPDTTTVARARRGLGLLLASKGQFGPAIEQLELARQLNPIDADVLSDLAYAHLLEGHLDGARLPIMQAAQLAPNNARVQLNQALYFLASGHVAEAGQLLQRLRQPQARNAAPLIDEGSLQTLHSQLDLVRQAVLRRAAAPAASTVVPTALDAQAIAPDSSTAAPEGASVAAGVTSANQPAGLNASSPAAGMTRSIVIQHSGHAAPPAPQL